MNKRLVYVDYIRVLACMMVVAIHVSAEYIFITEVGSLEYNLAFFLDKISRIAVPLFFMISGKLYLSREEFNFKLFLRKTWFPLLFAYLVWNIIYALRRGYSSFGVLLSECSFHLWFIPVILGLYLLIPVLRSLNKDLLKLLLLITFIMEILFTTLRLSFPQVQLISQIASMQYSSYLFYFLLGYFIDVKRGHILYGVIWILSNICFGYLSLYVFHNIDVFFEYNHLVVCFEACCFYLFIKGIATRNCMMVKRFGMLTLDIYFCHVAFIYLVKTLGFIEKYSMFVVYIMVFLGSILLSLLLSIMKGGKKDFMLSRR